MNQHTLAFGNGYAVFKVPFANAKKNFITDRRWSDY